MIARTRSSTPPTAIPIIRNGSSSSHISGYNTNTRRAAGQHKTSNTHHNRNFSIRIPYLNFTISLLSLFRAPWVRRGKEPIERVKEVTIQTQKCGSECSGCAEGGSDATQSWLGFKDGSGRISRDSPCRRFMKRTDMISHHIRKLASGQNASS
jgi:hypothetical protein